MEQEIENEILEIKNRLKKLEERVFSTETKPVKTNEYDVKVDKLTYVKQLKSVLDKCLAILDNLFTSDPSFSGLTPDEFVKIFREKFGLPIPLSSVSSQLYSASGSMVTRVKVVGKPIKYRYQILQAGQEYIRREIEKLQKA